MTIAIASRRLLCTWAIYVGRNYKGVAYIVMAYTVMAYIVMAYVVMALYSYGSI